MPAPLGVEPDALVAAQTALPDDGPRLDDVVARGRLDPGDKERPRSLQPVQPREVEVAPIHHIISSWIPMNLAEGSDLVLVSLVQPGKRRQVGPRVQQHVELHGGLRALPARSREKRQAQLNQRRVQREQVGVQAHRVGFFRVEPALPAHQHARHLGKQPPVAMLVRIRQIAALHRAANPGTIEQRAPRVEAGLDVAQALAVRQNGEDHRREVSVGVQGRGLAARRISTGTQRKLLAAQTAEYLRQNRFPGVHNRKSCRADRKSFAKNQIDHTHHNTLLADLESLAHDGLNFNQTAVGTARCACCRRNPTCRGQTCC
jgi:hypothetical protein